MNRPSLLHIIERLEGFLGKLPASIQKPVLQELTPLKELFLQQRAPRFVLTGSNQLTVHEVVSALFGWSAPRESRDILMELFRWQSIDLGGHGSINLLDARGAEARNIPDIGDELVREPADVFIHLGSDTERTPSDDISNLELFLASNGAARTEAGIIGVILHDAAHSARVVHNGEAHPLEKVDPRSKLQRALQEKLEIRKRLLQVCELSFTPDGPTGSETSTERQRFMGLAARAVPNEARVEMVRISRDKEAQVEISQMLVKSTTAICAAVGAQPIPLADLPILAALQLAMVSGIMYISGRERSLRAATEFLGALGINVGAGMLLREGTRALLKFFPGWGNVVCGMVAGAGTYAIGRATIVYFLEGVTLKEARRTYLTSRKKRAQRQPARIKEVETAP
ncbi:MAG: hypothetical protein DMF06_01905 [Verrucomicrobia bacterium]|nr:MAG: hypothetical protein DMF06_01905 [Verrucomicrobiota bacterium]